MNAMQELIADVDPTSSAGHARRWTLWFAVLGFAASGAAGAACMDSKAPRPQMPSRPAAAHFIDALYRPDAYAPARLVPTSDEGDAADAIVGLWQFQFSGFTADWGTQAWHSDGTEITFSVGQNPQTGDVCQGVWQRIGPRTYTLNHVAMGWAGPGVDPSKGAPFVRVHLHFTVTLDRSGAKFTGTYTAAVYLESSANPFNEDPATNPPIASGSGSVTATRLNPDPGP